MKLGFIGMGNMATAIAKGILDAGKVAPSDIIASCAHAEKAQAKSHELGISAGTDNKAVAAAADTLFLSCKPQQYADVIAEIGESVRPSTVVVTIAPGKTLDWLADRFAAGNASAQTKIVRCMPNTPALVGAGVTSYCANKNVTADELAQVEELLDCFGTRVNMPEKTIDAASAVGGSGPAFVYAFIEALADGGVAEGLPRAQAYEIAAQTVLGSAKMVLETGEHPGALKDAVCSPGGSTIKGMEALEKAAFRGATIDAVRTTAAAARAL